MLTRTIFAVVLFAVLKCCHAQPLPVISVAGPSGPSTWYPTNVSNPMMFWAELTPRNGTWGPTTAITPAADNTAVAIWTNFAITGNKWTKASAAFPTNFVSGGGGNGTSPRILFTTSSAQSTLTGGVIPNSTNQFTWMVVAQCTASTGIDFILGATSQGPPWLRYNALKIEITQGSTLATPATLVASQWYIITAVFAAGASSHIDTNGVTAVTGTAGTGVTGGSFTADISSFATANFFRGNISRIWGWYGVVGSTDLANAVAQCKKDFGIQ